MVNHSSREAKVDPLNIYEDLFAPLCGNNSIEGLVTPPYQYQRTAVARMLHQELYPSGYVPTLGELPLDTYPPELQSQPISCPHRCGKHHYTPVVNPLPSDIEQCSDNTTVRMRGGILAGKSRTGKILECLTLILLTKDQLACPTALNVPFTIPVCNLTYQRYLDHTLLSPYHYPDRHAQRCRGWENGSQIAGASFVDDSIEDKPCDTELSCLPNTNIVPPLRYLTFRQILHRPELTEKAREVLLPPDLKELLYVAGSSYLEERDFTTTYFDNPERPLPANVRHHQEDMVLFTDSTPDIPKFKSALAAIPSQGPKAWKRLRQGYTSIDPVHGKRHPFLSVIPSRTTLVIVPENYLITWESEIKKHIAPNALKYLVVWDYSKPSVTALLESDLVLISCSELLNAYCCESTISSVDFCHKSVEYISPPLLDWLLTTYVVRNHSEETVDEVTLPLCTYHTIRLNCGYHELHVYNFSLALFVTCMILGRIEGPEPGRPLYKFGIHWDLKALWYTPEVCESRIWEVKEVDFILKKVLLNPNEAGLTSTDISLLQQSARKHMKALTIRGCSSAKLTYLVNQLRRHTPHEKCVVYFNSATDFVKVETFMTLLKFQPADGASTKGYTFPDYEVRLWDDYGEDAIAEAIVEFTTNPNCRVLLMPTWLLFWRVDLTVATRVYFYSPVWCDSVEMHAIARVHHMGQTRPVHVETLVLSDTLEDAVLGSKSKSFRMEDYESRWAKSPEGKIMFALGKFLTPIWKRQVAVDDLVQQGSCETTRLESLSTNMAPGISRTAVDVSSVQLMPEDDGLQLRPEYYFDEPIPLLSLRIGRGLFH
ncbi:hypothetical protein IWQ61_000335 [Dispira simplex]|nr:hypothetical protein IWQ61_000335 [Dispira simplex]